MRKLWIAAAALILLLGAIGCAAGEAPAGEGGIGEVKLNVQIGEYDFAATMEDSAAAAELMQMLRHGPLTLEMDDYGGFEKVGPLGARLSAEDTQTTTEPGDIVLYNSSSVVMFYGSNSWAYTRLAHIDDLTDWEAALGSGGVTAVFSLSEE